MKSASRCRQVKYHNNKGLITNFLIKLDRGKPLPRRHNQVPSREKENRGFISPSPATTRKLQKLKSTASRSVMVPADNSAAALQQPSNSLKRASSSDCIVLSSDSEQDDTPRVTLSKRLCIRSKETTTSIVTVPLSRDVHEVIDLSIDQSTLPHWLRDPSDSEDSYDSDCSLVSTSALYQPKKRVKLSSETSCSSPSSALSYSPVNSPTFQLSLDTCSTTSCFSPALPDDAFQNLSMEDTPPSSPALPVESSSSMLSSLILSTSKAWRRPSVDNTADLSPAINQPRLDWSSLVTNPPYLEDLQLILSRRGLLSVVKRATVSQLDKTRLFTAYQESNVEQLITSELFSPYMRILNTVDYLKQILSCRRMPQANLISLLWTSAINLGEGFDVAGNAIAEVFRLIVMTHPPSTKTCRREYQKFLQSQDAYCLWEQLSCAINGPPWKVALASSLVDVLLIDYHAIHTSDLTSSTMLPLFHTLFWQAGSSNGGRTITRPVRQLLEMTTTSETENNGNYEKVCCCYSMLFLLATACRSITPELYNNLSHLPAELLSAAITRVLPGSLRLALYKLLSDKPSPSLPIQQILIAEMNSSSAFHFNCS